MVCKFSNIRFLVFVISSALLSDYIAYGKSCHLVPHHTTNCMYHKIFHLGLKPINVLNKISKIKPKSSTTSHAHSMLKHVSNLKHTPTLKHASIGTNNFPKIPKFSNSKVHKAKAFDEQSFKQILILLNGLYQIMKCPSSYYNSKYYLKSICRLSTSKIIETFILAAKGIQVNKDINVKLKGKE